MRLYARTINSVDALIWPDRAADPERLTAYQRAVPFFEHHWQGARAEHWSLETLGVLPEHQGKGYGRQLVMWGLKQAEEEGVAASVVCSAGSERFYKKCGFEIEVGSVTEGEGNPLSVVKGGTILFRDALVVDHVG